MADRDEQLVVGIGPNGIRPRQLLSGTRPVDTSRTAEIHQLPAPARPSTSSSADPDPELRPHRAIRFKPKQVVRLPIPLDPGAAPDLVLQARNCRTIMEAHQALLLAIAAGTYTPALHLKLLRTLGRTLTATDAGFKLLLAASCPVCDSAD